MIRKLEKKDFELVNKLGIKLFSNFDNVYDLENYLNNDNYIILVNVDDYINAFLIVLKNIDFYELEAIIVDESLRGKGIASNLLEFFVNNYLKKDDVILLEVAVNNVKAINLYKKFCFEIINTRKKYYKDIDAYVMKKVI